MPERDFLIFEFFCYFFRNFLARVEYERNWGLKFLSLFLGLTQTILDRNNAGIYIFSFLNFFWNFLARVGYEQNSGLKFFFLFLSISHPVLPKNINGKRFFNFLTFFAIFFGIFLPGSSMIGIGN